jgi:hypothetical protein
MLYLIGGAPRVGKTTLAHSVMMRRHIPYISTDVLTQALDASFPELKIRNIEWSEIPQRFYVYLHAFSKYSQECMKDYLIEGVSIRPDHASKLAKEFNVKSCFLGASRIDLTDIKRYSIFDDWVGRLPQEEQLLIPARIVSLSSTFEAECTTAKIPYFNVAHNWTVALEQAYSSLFGN